jgi:histidine ammonia-lyase
MSLALSFDKASANERLTVGDVANVAQQNFSVVVEQCPETQELTASKIVEALASAGKATVASDIGIVQTVRASLFCRLYSLCSNPSIAASNSFYLVRQLTTLLNAGIIPTITNEESSGASLLAALNGVGNCLVQTSASTAYSVPITEAFALAGLPSIRSETPLSEGEMSAVLDYPFYYIGAACLLSYGSLNLCNTLDCVAAMSCEAVGERGIVECFDNAYFEVGRPQRGQMSSASNLRMLLEGSKRLADGKKDDKEKDANAVKKTAAATVAFKSVPQINGPCAEIFAATAKTIEIELNSAETTSATGSIYNASQAKLAVLSMTAAFSELRDAC